MFFPHFSISLLAVGQLVVPLRCMLLAQVVHSDLVEGLQLVVLQLDGGRQVPSLHLLYLILVYLHHVEFLLHDREGKEGGEGGKEEMERGEGRRRGREERKGGGRRRRGREERVIHDSP